MSETSEKIVLTTCDFDLLVFTTYGEVITHQALCSEVHPDSYWGMFPKEFHPGGCPHKDVCGGST